MTRLHDKLMVDVRAVIDKKASLQERLNYPIGRLRDIDAYAEPRIGAGKEEPPVKEVNPRMNTRILDVQQIKSKAYEPSTEE